MLDKISDFIAQPIPQQVLFFDEMLTPKLIRLAYWLCLFLVVTTGLGYMFSNGFSGFIGGLVYTIAGVILARVAAELIILFFQINENIETVAKNSRPSKATKTTTRKRSKKTTKKA